MTGDMAADAAELCETRAAAWHAVRSFNAGTATTQDMHDAAERLDEMAEAFRRRHFPRAHSLFALSDPHIGQRAEIYTRSRTGRSTRRVWAA